MTLQDLEESLPRSLQLHSADMTDDNRVKAAIDDARERHGRIDVVVNNAVDLRQSPEAFRRSLEKNLVHYFSAVHFALDDLIESRGVILNIAAKTAGTSRLQSS